jgi:hypothetical protein
MLNLHVHQSLTAVSPVGRDRKSYYPVFGRVNVKTGLPKLLPEWAGSTGWHVRRVKERNQRTRARGIVIVFLYLGEARLHRRIANQRQMKEILMAEAVQNRCAHPKCTCPVGESEQYCSQACSDATESSSGNDRCACPHPQCSSAMAA